MPMMVFDTVPPQLELRMMGIAFIGAVVGHVDGPGLQKVFQMALGGIVVADMRPAAGIQGDRGVAAHVTAA